MRTISDTDWKLVMDILSNYAHTEIESSNIKARNLQRRARLLVRKLERSKRVDYHTIKKIIQR